MGKATVESRQRLDAHFWGQEPIRKAASSLAERLTVAQAQWRAGATPAQTGLIEMKWTRGGGSIPAGSIQWGILQEDGGHALRLLLLFSVTSGGEKYPRRQEVRLSWTTSAGKPSRHPVLLCPFCGRRCRFLCAAYPGRRGGPYLGEFACRVCANLCYEKQLECESSWVKNYRAILKLSAKASLHPERFTEADLATMEDLAQRPMSFGSRLDKLLARAEQRGTDTGNLSLENTDDLSAENISDKNLSDKNLSDGISLLGKEKPEKPRKWDVLPPPVFTVPKRRGRPSVKCQRQQARACARIVREAEQLARPKRPAGRPKERRGYNAAGRRAGGCAGQLGPEEGYCVGCRARRQLVEAVPFTASNGRSGIKGKCAACGRGLCRMGM